MKLMYKENTPVSAREITRLRCSVGWNGMESCYADPRMAAFDHIACDDGDQLIGFADTVSNGVTDAYIQSINACFH